MRRGAVQYDEIIDGHTGKVMGIKVGKNKADENAE